MSQYPTRAWFVIGLSMLLGSVLKVTNEFGQVGQNINFGLTFALTGFAVIVVFAISFSNRRLQFPDGIEFLSSSFSWVI